MTTDAFARTLAQGSSRQSNINGGLGLRVVSTRLGIGVGTSDTTSAQPLAANQINYVYLPGSASGVRAVFAGWTMTSQGSIQAEYDMPNPVTYQASIEKTFGSVLAFPFRFGGANAVTVFPGGDLVLSDPLAGSIPAGSIGVRTFASVVNSSPSATFTGAISGTTLTVTNMTDGSFIRLGYTLQYLGIGAAVLITAQPSGSAGSNGTYTLGVNLGTVSAQTMTTTRAYPLGRIGLSGLSETAAATKFSPSLTLGPRVSGLVTTSRVCPLALVGIPDNTQQHSVCIYGDSIAFGQGDISGDANGNSGYIERALNRNLPWATTSRSGNAYAKNAGRNYGQVNFASNYCTDIIINLGINDFTSLGLSLAVTQAYAIAEWTALSVNGSRIWLPTLTPRSTSSDGWATLGNQTTDANNANRVAWNNWVRDGAPILNGVAAATGSSATGTIRIGNSAHPVKGYFETADLAESARDSGKWRVDLGALTTDGIHPNDLGHATIAAAISVSAINAIAL